MTVNANLAKKHYENRQWEDQSKNASRFIYYNLYEVVANVATPYELFGQKTALVRLTFLKVRENPNIVSRRTSVWNSCTEPAVHNLNFKLSKDCDLFIDAKVDFKHCGNADGIDSSWRPYVLVAFPYWMMTFEVDYVEF